jgi:hypothetical protein
LLAAISEAFIVALFHSTFKTFLRFLLTLAQERRKRLA